MDWQSILLSVLSIVLTALVTWGAERLIALINSKISNTKYSKYLTEAVQIVTRAVKTTYQTYVQALKDKDMFDKESQLQALNMGKTWCWRSYRKMSSNLLLTTSAVWRRGFRALSSRLSMISSAQPQMPQSRQIRERYRSRLNIKRQPSGKSGDCL